jgi:stage V sporulation protein G
MNGLEITDIRVRPCEQEDDRLKAFATVTFNNCFVVCDLKVIQGPNRLFVAMPSRKRKDGSFRDVAHPLNQDFREVIESEVLKIYEAELGVGAKGPQKVEGDVAAAE